MKKLEMKDDPKLTKLLKESVAKFKALPAEERNRIIREQGISYAIAEATPCEHGNDWDECPECRM